MKKMSKNFEKNIITINNLTKIKKLKEEKITMIKKYLTVGVTLLTFLVHVLPAQAYTQLQTPVSVTATGTIDGVTIAFAAEIVSQGAGLHADTITFNTTSGIVNSGEALKIRGGTNVVGGRVIIYTDNASYFSKDHDPREKKEGTVYRPTGSDGAGLVGQTEPGYVAALIWNVSTTPNTNAVWTPDGNLNDKIGEVYVVDKGHTYSFVGTGTPTDTQILYTKDGTPVPDVQGAIDLKTGLKTPLYTQYFGAIGTLNWDLYDSSGVVVSQALYKNITTIAYNIAPGTGVDAGYYVCNMPKISTANVEDMITARLGKVDGSAGTEIYVNIGADFTGLPAQKYETTKLYVAIIGE